MTHGSGSYLDLAEQVLLRVRRPMSTKEVMSEAYLRGLVPPHLYGRTQWKTLGARLSEDILLLRENSRFYRAHPGRFLLTAFLEDEAIPAEHRKPIIAKRRRRELKRKDVVLIPRKKVPRRRGGSGEILIEDMATILKSHDVIYATDYNVLIDNYLPLVSFMVVMKGHLALSYRLGHYRESRDSFEKKRSIGFTTPVTRYDNSLFDHTDHGAVRAGVAAMATDLDLRWADSRGPLEDAAELLTYIQHDEMPSGAVILAVIRFEAWEGFEPFTKRLAINDLAWVDIGMRFNDFDDFDPWSKHIIERKRHKLIG